MVMMMMMTEQTHGLNSSFITAVTVFKVMKLMNPVSGLKEAKKKRRLTLVLCGGGGGELICRAPTVRGGRVEDY